MGQFVSYCTTICVKRPKKKGQTVCSHPVDAPGAHNVPCVERGRPPQPPGPPSVAADLECGPIAAANPPIPHALTPDPPVGVCGEGILAGQLDIWLLVYGYLDSRHTMRHRAVCRLFEASLPTSIASLSTRRLPPYLPYRSMRRLAELRSACGESASPLPRRPSPALRSRRVCGRGS